MTDIESDFVHLVRLALDGKQDDVRALARRGVRTLARSRPELADELRRLVSRADATSALRSAEPIPVDLDSRLELVRREDHPEILVEPVWPETVRRDLESTVAERLRQKELTSAGLPPTRSLLFVGPPGVGKTLAARWLARQLRVPLLTLDLASVMSSFLGRTGNNIRVVLDYARRTPTVLLLDEFDAIAKRRDDVGEIGELKRLVTVLLQSVDEWPAEGLLVAATNHAELLDPAVWRRFDRVVQFPLPSRDETRSVIVRLLRDEARHIHEGVIGTLTALLEGKSFADISRFVLLARRAALLEGTSTDTALLEHAGRVAHEQPLATRLELARLLGELGHSQRSVSELTGLSRDTIRKHGDTHGVTRSQGVK